MATLTTTHSYHSYVESSVSRRMSGSHFDVQEKTKAGDEVDEARAELFGKHLSLEHYLPAALASPSPWESPSQWLEVNKRAILRDVVIPQLAEIIGETLVHPRLLFHVLNTLVVCEKLIPETHNLLDNFRDAFKAWESWDPLSCLINSERMKNYLLSLISRLHEIGIQLLPQHDLLRILALDGLATCAYLSYFLSDHDRYQSFVSSTGDQAQSLLNLVQDLLDYADLDRKTRRRFLQAIIRLSQRARLYPDCLVLPRLDERDEDPISQGSFGDVYRGVIKGKKVAVKVMRKYETSNLNNLLKDFSREAVLWRQLSHPNLLPFYGVYHYKEDRNRVCMVSPWMENGNVRYYLEKNPEAHRISLVYDIISGLEYLHTMDPCIVHGDLKGVNILVSDEHVACLADFGLSSAAQESFQLSLSMAGTQSSGAGPVGGTLRWQAPELMDFNIATTKSTPESDIYSFASVCYEIYTDRVPHFQIARDPGVIQAVLNGIRPSRPDEQTAQRTGLTDDLWKLMLQCWRSVPSERPSATQIRDFISGMKSESPIRRRTRSMPSGTRHRRRRGSTIGSRPSTKDDDEETRTMMMTLTRSVEELQLDHDVVAAADQPEHIAQGPLDLLHEFIDFNVDPRQHFQCTRVIANVEGGQVVVARVLAATPTPASTSRNASLYGSGVLRAPTGALIAVKVVATNKIQLGWAHKLNKDLRIIRDALFRQEKVTTPDSDGTNGPFHPHIFFMNALYIDHEDDLLWIAMELLDRNLYRVITQTMGSGQAGKGRKGVVIKENIIARFAHDLLSGIEFLQNAGVAHRDLRPAVLWFNGAGYLKISNFTNAFVVLDPTAPICTERPDDAPFYYQSPEMRLEGQYNAFLADIWSLGAIVWETTQGEPPYMSHGGFGQSKTHTQWPPLSPIQGGGGLWSDDLQAFLEMCSRPEGERPGPSELLQHPFVQNSCGRWAVAQLLRETQ